jgi:hypothetical protein
MGVEALRHRDQAKSLADDLVIFNQVFCLVELWGFEPQTSCMPSAGRTSARVHRRRSPSPSVSGCPPLSGPVAVLACSTFSAQVMRFVTAGSAHDQSLASRGYMVTLRFGHCVIGLLRVGNPGLLPMQALASPRQWTQIWPAIGICPWPPSDHLPIRASHPLGSRHQANTTRPQPARRHMSRRSSAGLSARRHRMLTGPKRASTQRTCSHWSAWLFSEQAHKP